MSDVVGLFDGVTVREVHESDLDRLREIYNDAVEHTLATMDTEPRSAEQMTQWWHAHRGERYIARVAEVEGSVVGYGFLSPFAGRGGYQASCEISIYLARAAQGRGIGSLFMRELTRYGLAVGFSTVMGFATSTNTASIRMMRSEGYTFVGTLRDAARKHGRLVSLSIWQKLPG